MKLVGADLSFPALFPWSDDFQSRSPGCSSIPPRRIQIQIQMQGARRDFCSPSPTPLSAQSMLAATTRGNQQLPLNCHSRKGATYVAPALLAPSPVRDCSVLPKHCLQQRAAPAGHIAHRSSTEPEHTDPAMRGVAAARIQVGRSLSMAVAADEQAAAACTPHCGLNFHLPFADIPNFPEMIRSCMNVTAADIAAAAETGADIAADGPVHEVQTTADCSPHSADTPAAGSSHFADAPRHFDAPAVGPIRTVFHIVAAADTVPVVGSPAPDQHYTLEQEPVGVVVVVAAAEA